MITYFKDIFFLYVYYFIYCPVIIGFSYIITRKFIQWKRGELWVLIIPFLVWFLLNLSSIKNKSLANTIELKYIAIVIGVINCFSLFFLKGKPEVKPIFDILASIVLVILVYFLFPFLPE